MVSGAMWAKVCFSSADAEAHRSDAGTRTAVARKRFLRNGPDLGNGAVVTQHLFPGLAGCSWPALIGGLWHVWGYRVSALLSVRHRSATLHRVAPSGFYGGDRCLTRSTAPKHGASCALPASGATGSAAQRGATSSPWWRITSSRARKVGQIPWTISPGAASGATMPAVAQVSRQLSVAAWTARRVIRGTGGERSLGTPQHRARNRLHLMQEQLRGLFHEPHAAREIVLSANLRCYNASLGSKVRR